MTFSILSQNADLLIYGWKGISISVWLQDSWAFFVSMLAFVLKTYSGQLQPLSPWEDFQPFCSLPPSLGRGINNDLLSNPLCENDPVHHTLGSGSAVKDTLLSSNDLQRFSGRSDWGIVWKSHRLNKCTPCSPWVTLHIYLVRNTLLVQVKMPFANFDP